MSCSSPIMKVHILAGVVSAFRAGIYDRAGPGGAPLNIFTAFCAACAPFFPMSPIFFPVSLRSFSASTLLRSPLETKETREEKVKHRDVGSG